MKKIALRPAASPCPGERGDDPLRLRRILRRLRRHRAFLPRLGEVFPTKEASHPGAALLIK